MWIPGDDIIATILLDSVHAHQQYYGPYGPAVGPSLPKPIIAFGHLFVRILEILLYFLFPVFFHLIHNNIADFFVNYAYFLVKSMMSSAPA